MISPLLFGKRYSPATKDKQPAKSTRRPRPARRIVAVEAGQPRRIDPTPIPPAGVTIPEADSPDVKPDSARDGKTRRIAINARLLDDFEAADCPVTVLDGKHLG